MTTPGTSILRRAGAAVGATALVAAGVLAAPAALADTSAVSYAEARILSGSLVGADLDGVVALDAAIATNDGSQPTQVSKDPLGATVLDTVRVTDPDGIQLSSDEIDSGVIGQYAEARADGISLAAAGAVTSDGGIGVGEVGDGPGTNLTVDLDSAVSTGYADVLTDLGLTLDAVAAQARAELTTASGDYRLTGATLVFSSPAIADLSQKVDSALDTVDGSLVELGSDDGTIGLAVDRVLDPVLAAIDSSADVSVVIDADVRSAVESLLRDAYGDGTVRFNLEDGTVSVDLDAVHGGTLNNLPPNTELLSADVMGPVLNRIADTVDTLADQIVDRVRAALGDATVSVTAGLDLLTSQGTTQQEVCQLIDVPILGDVLGEDGLVDDLLGGGGLLGGGTDGGLLGGGGGVLGGLLGKGIAQGPTGKDIIGWTTETVCQLVDVALPSLQSTVDVRVDGTVDDLIDGTASTATANVSLLGGTVNAALNTGLVVDAIGDGLLDGLFGDDGTIDGLIEALDSGLVLPAETGLLGDASVYDVLTDVLSVRVNVQETATTDTGSMFTQTAVRISALGGVGSLDVAAATVGPNVEAVDPGCTVNCGPGGEDPDCVTNCGGGGTTPTGTGPGGLALTGVGIAMLIQVILALLACGAALAYAGYRRSHPKVSAEEPAQV